MTEAGKRLLADWHDGVRITKAGKRIMIAAIVAEAVAAERARIVAGVKALLDAAMMTDDGSLDEVVDALHAVLRIIEGAER